MKYLAHYALPNNKEQRSFTLSAVTKINYICSALNSLGIPVEIISASKTNNTKKYYSGETLQISPMLTLTTLCTFPTGNILKRLIRTISSNLALFFALLKVKRHEAIIAYHSLGFMKVLHLAHKIKKFQLILEVEEIYSDVTKNEKMRRKELEFFKTASAYIFPTKLLNELVNVNQKPAVIVHGTYRSEEIRDTSESNSSPTIHCVYAGTFDPRKGGAHAAISSAEFLPSNYHLHVLGFGSPADIKAIKSAIEETAKKSSAKVTMDGMLSGEEYIRFIQKCHIGLSTQNPSEAFNATSFPSKILSYMANGLRVVSIRIPVVESSDVANMLYYYDEQTPENIAKAIMTVDIAAPYDSKALLSQLDVKFKMEIKNLIERNH